MLLYFLRKFKRHSLHCTLTVKASDQVLVLSKLKGPVYVRIYSEKATMTSARVLSLGLGKILMLQVLVLS